MDWLRLNRPIIGVGVQGQDWRGLREWGPEGILVLDMDRWALRDLYIDVPPAERPWCILRFYHPNTMSNEPFSYGQRCGDLAYEFAREWGPKFAAAIIENEQNLGIEHANVASGPFWQSHDGYGQIRDWLLRAMKGFDASAGADLDLIVLNLAPGHGEDGPDVAATGWYGYQPDLLGDVVRYR